MRKWNEDIESSQKKLNLMICVYCNRQEEAVETDGLALLCFLLLQSRSNVGGHRFAEESSQKLQNLSLSTKL